MRCEGDRLLLHLRDAKRSVILCAPFIKSAVLKRILKEIPEHVSVRVVTRWRAEDIRAGVSDLEVFEIMRQRKNGKLEILADLHAKIYLCDGQALVGSANLTATALGWRNPSSIEILVPMDRDADEVKRFLLKLDTAHPATEEEKHSIFEEIAKLLPRELSNSEDILEDETIGLWLPQLSAPNRLFEAYQPSRRDRLQRSVLETADAELQALGIAPGLDHTQFKTAVAQAFTSMPAVERLLDLVEENGLDDVSAIQLVSELVGQSTLSAERQWEIIRDWFDMFLADRLEIVPETFFTRRRPGVRRS